MKEKTVFLVIAILGLILPSCSPSMALPTPTESRTSTLTPIPTSTNTPSLTPFPTPTVIPTPTQIPIADYELIMVLDDKVNRDVSSLSFSYDGSLLAVGYYDTTIRVWQMSDSCIKYKLNEQDAKWNFAVAISPDGTLLVSSFNGRSDIQLWNLSEGLLSRRIENIYLEENDLSNRKMYFEFSPDIQMWLGVGDVVEMRSVSNGTLLHSFESDYYFADGDLSPDGEMIAASIRHTNDILIWRVRDGKLLHLIDQKDSSSSSESYFVQVGFSNDGKVLVASDKNTINLWDLQTEAVIASYQAESEDERFGEIIFSPDDRYLLGMVYLGGYSNRIKLHIWDVTHETLLRIIERPTGEYFSYRNFVLSPNGKYLAIGARHGKVFVYGVPENPPTNSCLPPKLINGDAYLLPQFTLSPHIDLLPLSPVEYATRDDWYGFEDGNAITLEGPFSITMNLDSHGEYSAITLSGRISKGREWWRGIIRLYVGVYLENDLLLEFHDGNSENAITIDLSPPIQPGDTLTIRFLDPKGRVLQIYDSQNRIVAEYDVTHFTEISLPDGLFPDERLYTGILVSPNAEFSITKFFMEFNNP